MSIHRPPAPAPAVAPEAAAVAAPTPAAPVPRVSSQDLLRGGQELWIDHDGACYRLRLTAQGRLILTK